MSEGDGMYRLLNDETEGSSAFNSEGVGRRDGSDLESMVSDSSVIIACRCWRREEERTGVGSRGFRSRRVMGTSSANSGGVTLINGVPSGDGDCRSESVSAKLSRLKLSASCSIGVVGS